MLVHPIFKVLLRKPQLLADHASSYAALFREEAASALSILGWRALGWAAVVLGVLVFLVLAGVAAMLAAVLGQWHWMLAAAPLSALLLAVLGVWLARRTPVERPMTQLRSQIQADAAALRLLGSP